MDFFRRWIGRAGIQPLCDDTRQPFAMGRWFVFHKFSTHVRINHLERAGRSVAFMQKSTGDQAVDMDGYGRYGFIVQCPHDFAVAGTISITLDKATDEFEQFVLFFTWPVVHALPPLLVLMRLAPTIRLTPYRPPRRAGSDLLAPNQHRWRIRPVPASRSCPAINAAES